MKITPIDDHMLAHRGRLLCLPLVFMTSLLADLQICSDASRTYRIDLEEGDESLRFYAPYEEFRTFYVTWNSLVCMIGTGPNSSYVPDCKGEIADLVREYKKYIIKRETPNE